ncbi:MAG: hypothetical protein AUH32_01980 [Actinobacteria bacterium 13_1_40CM_66_12]|nr:MAG: hypothetical protein AUH32_01980 [Actinobacteria bacterium 13_1_40CM_66_12]
MQHLPPNFADDLAQMLEPSHRGEAAGIIEAATALDDEGLRTFLDLFAQRVRASARPITHAELQRFLATSKKSGHSHGL